MDDNIQDQLGTKVLKVRKVDTPLNSDNPADYADVLVDDDYDGEWFSELVPWLRIDRAGYVSITTNHARKMGIPLYLHHIVARPPKGKWVRFKNQNPLDCRSTNLEAVTPKELLSRRKPRGYRLSDKPLSHSKYRGVHGYGDKWQAIFRKEYLGTFDTEIEAAKAYDKAKWGYERKRQKLNFPEDFEDQLMQGAPTTATPRRVSGKSLGLGRFR